MYSQLRMSPSKYVPPYIQRRLGHVFALTTATHSQPMIRRLISVRSSYRFPEMNSRDLPLDFLSSTHSDSVCFFCDHDDAYRVFVRICGSLKACFPARGYIDLDIDSSEGLFWYRSGFLERDHGAVLQRVFACDVGMYFSGCSVLELELAVTTSMPIPENICHCYVWLHCMRIHPSRSRLSTLWKATELPKSLRRKAY